MYSSLHGHSCCYYTVTCVAITRSLVLLLHGHLCCYYTVTCVVITRSLVLLLHGHLCCYYTVTRVVITRSLVLLLHGHFLKDLKKYFFLMVLKIQCKSHTHIHAHAHTYTHTHTQCYKQNMNEIYLMYILKKRKKNEIKCVQSFNSALKGTNYFFVVFRDIT